MIFKYPVHPHDLTMFHYKCKSFVMLRKCVVHHIKPSYGTLNQAVNVFSITLEVLSINNLIN